MKMISTHDLHIGFGPPLGFTVMPQSQLIILNEWVNYTENLIKMYKISKDKLCLEKTIKAPCGHGYTRLLGLVINHNDVLAVSCRECQNIRLLNLVTEQVMEAYSGEGAGYMCHGRKGKVFVK